MEAWKLIMESRGDVRPVVADLRKGSCPDPHESEMSDPDPHLGDADQQSCY
jgi:hypothetical protein